MPTIDLSFSKSLPFCRLYLELETCPLLNEPMLAIADGKFFCIAAVVSDNDKGGLWAFNDAWLYTPTKPQRFVKGEYVHVTHWMPLPALPKDADKQAIQVVNKVN